MKYKWEFYFQKIVQNSKEMLGAIQKNLHKNPGPTQVWEP